MRRLGLASPKEQVVVLVTGHGLKDVDAALRNIRIPEPVDPTAEGLEAAVRRLNKKGVRR